MKRNFNRLVIITLLVFSQSFSSYAQDSISRFGVMINFGNRDAMTDIGNNFLKFDPFSPTFGMGVFYYLSPWFDAGVTANLGKLSQNGSDAYLGQSLNIRMADFNAVLKYKFYNNHLISDTALFGPFFTLGVGAFSASHINLSYNPVSPANAIAMNIPIGLGTRVRINDALSAVVQMTYNYTVYNKYDGIDLDPRFGSNDSYVHTSVGLIYTFGKKKVYDRDKDGVVDKLDKCPGTRAGYLVDSLTGCDLDSDKDSIVDTEDKCPMVAGLRKFDGCPDTDGDGVQDSQDKCPTVAGLAKFGGCPDTDGDGIEDALDLCPTVAGVAAFKGCPDTDADGIEDSKDRCPQVAGLIELGGCPQVKKEIVEKVNLVAKGVFFETGKTTISKASFDDLDALVSILQTEATVKCLIEGHTDNKGDAAKNEALSQLRAEEIKKYLESKGIDGNRLTAKGFGSSVPLADNKTEKGRAKNRRVMFKLEY